MMKMLTVRTNLASALLIFSTICCCCYDLSLKKYSLVACAFSIGMPNKMSPIQVVAIKRSILNKLSAKSKWDDLDDDDDDDDNIRIQQVPRDMRYVECNLLRQNQNFVAIRDAGGAEVTNDMYVRDPETDIFWFVGKVARVSGVTLKQAIARQWAMVEEHAARLRPLEIYPKRGGLEIWSAPGDSELDVAYNKPSIQFIKMDQNVEGADKIKNLMLGFQGELYEPGEDGFRTRRTNDGMPKLPEVSAEAEKGEKRPPTDDEIEEIATLLKGKDLKTMFEEDE